MITVVKLVCEILLQLLGYLLTQKSVKDAAKEQTDAQKTQNEIDADPVAWFSKHFNSGVQRVTTETDSSSTTDSTNPNH